MIELKAGHRYVRRDGKETGPLARTDSPSKPFRDNQTNMWYGKDGRISEQYEYPQDIVSGIRTPSLK